MFFFCKKPTIVVDCFLPSDLQHIAECSPITHATKHYPDWWRNLPAAQKEPTVQGVFYETPTMKTCYGFFEYYKKSLAIPMWCELAIKVYPNRTFQWQFSDGVSVARIHPDSQRGTHMPSHSYSHLKIVSPWLLKTKENIDWILTQPTYNFERPELFTVPPGLMNFKEQHATNIQLFINLKQAEEYIINRNQVIGHLTPLTEKRIEVKRHVVSIEEHNAIRCRGRTTQFVNKFLGDKRAREKFSDCPFSKFTD